MYQLWAYYLHKKENFANDQTKNLFDRDYTNRPYLTILNWLIQIVNLYAFTYSITFYKFSQVLP